MNSDLQEPVILNPILFLISIHQDTKNIQEISLCLCAPATALDIFPDIYLVLVDIFSDLFYNGCDTFPGINLFLARENKKFKYSDVKKGGRASRFEGAIEWLRKAGLIYIIHNLKKPSLPLAGYADQSKFKIYTVDSGLLGAMLDVPSRIIITGDSLFSEYNGAFIENYAAGELVNVLQNSNIFYWTSKNEAEVDFVFSIDGRVFPLEVKSGLSRRTKSLRIYADLYGAEQVFRASPRNFTRDGDFVNVPLYAVSLLTRTIISG